MKKLSCLFTFVFLFINIAIAQQAKYVFYFIGDGMGVNQVLCTEMYNSELKGEIGITPLLFTQFPYCTTATTFSATNGVTDSAAAGTALATGNKTKNGAIGVKKDLTSTVNSIAVLAKNRGKSVGIATSVSVDHATPAAFYGHQGSRSSYYNMGLDLINTGFDFYAGSDFLDPYNSKMKDKKYTDLYTLTKKAGYNLVRGYDEFKKNVGKSSKMILFQPDSAKDNSSIPYAIDRKPGNLSLQEITTAAVDFLYSKSKNGFFLMVEGGKIDWACHSNDAATVVNEIMDMDNAIKIAYDFYKKHQNETLIVVTADHETGGFALGNGQYALNLKALSSQKVSVNGFTSKLNELRKKYNNKVPWDVVKKGLEENFGFWDSIKLNDKEEKRLMDVYDKTFNNQENVNLEKSEYQQDEPLANEAMKILNHIALVGWTSGGHSAGYVPVFAIGAGAEKFQGRMDNTEIPERIAKAAGYKY